MTDRSKRIALIGAPTDVGGGGRGAVMGPEALRVAGLEDALRRLRYRVTDRGNLGGPPNPQQPKEKNGYRHLPEVTHWCAAARDAVLGALREGDLPILMGGDHSLAIGSIAAVAQHCAQAQTPLSVLWLDAHADYNLPASSPTGNLHGMPVAVVTGHGPDELTALSRSRPMLDPQQVALVGIRSVDEVEKRLVVEDQLVVYDMRTIDELGMRAVMEQALVHAPPNGHLHVSLDVDFLDPAIAPGVDTAVPGGPTYREAQLCMEMIHDSGRLGSLDIMELNPACDERNRTARLVVELVESLFGEQILARAHAEPSRYRL